MEAGRPDPRARPHPELRSSELIPRPRAGTGLRYCDLTHAHADPDAHAYRNPNRYSYAGA